MALAMRSNGLHHAVSLGSFESTGTRHHHLDRTYDSDDENMNRRRLRHTLSTELHARPSIYSKGDIREQYCLTDRQLNTIERSRLDRFFGCLSNRNSPQSFLGVCVGRRAPSDENLAAYAPFYRQPRYPHQRALGEEIPKADVNSSSFRRQPASILSTPKMTDGSRYTWVGLPASTSTHNPNQNTNYTIDPSSYQHQSTATVGFDAKPQSNLGSTTPRTKHVSFARSHTLTSFDDVNVGLHSSLRLKGARSQERLIGGKKLSLETPIVTPTYIAPSAVTMLPVPSVLKQPYPYFRHQPHGHSHLAPVHMHSCVPTYGAGVQVTPPLPGVSIVSCTMQDVRPPSPEVLIVEKRFRNTMKTQATQTEVRKDGLSHVLALSPRTIHKVKVVSQSAQTNGLQNSKNITKSLSEMPDTREFGTTSDYNDHELLQNDNFDEDPRSPLEFFANFIDRPSNISYYQPPPPLDTEDYIISPPESETKAAEMFQYAVDIHTPPHFEFESNSLPRRTCTFHRMESAEYNSHSLPRTEPFQSHELCRHITECTELMPNTDCSILDLSRPNLLPPPSQYCKSDDEDYTNSAKEASKLSLEPDVRPSQRRMSMIPLSKPENDLPFRRDDIRRQSMPIFVKTEKLIDGRGNRSLLRTSSKNKSVPENREEEEIFIDFKPNVLMKSLESSRRKQKSYVRNAELAMMQHISTAEECEECASLAADIKTSLDSEDEREDPLYENVPGPFSQPMDDLKHVEYEKRHVQYRKRSVSLDEVQGQEEKSSAVSGPPSPYREDIANTSTYPSSDSLVNDTRDHSDGIWNESQVTVLTALQKEASDVIEYSSNLLLTPTSRRKSLLLQHQQRSSIDTDAIELEEAFTDSAATYVNTLKPQTLQIPQSSTEQNNVPMSFTISTKVGAPTIAVTPSLNDGRTSRTSILMSSPAGSRRSSRAFNTSTVGSGRIEIVLPNPELSNSYMERSDFERTRTNADVSECSTNTDDYGTCTDNSKRTPGIKSPPPTSSSSTTQVPVSAQSSQMDKTHGGSSFESASSLYSTRGELSIEEPPQQDNNLLKAKSELEIKNIPKRSPSHSISSASSGSYNVAGLLAVSPLNITPKLSPEKSISAEVKPKIVIQREKSKIKLESMSDEDRSERRYSSSGYYESPQHEDYNTTKANRKNRMEEERKRRKTCMKLNIEKENMRALTSPIKKSYSNMHSIQIKSAELKSTPHVMDITSPTRMKRIRPKIRRQLRKLLRDESLPTISGVSPSRTTEKLLDFGTPNISHEDNTVVKLKVDRTKAISESNQLNAKSIESLRSVSPGSDSVFYSEADGTIADSQPHCLHCGKEMEGAVSATSTQRGDSIESLQGSEHDLEQDIVKPPSDFADSPVTTKTTQRLYKKTDKRFRSEERYHGERGRHYKTRKENIRAKSEERSREHQLRSSQNLRSSGSSPSVLPDVNTEQNSQTVYRGHYLPGRYARLTDADVWAQLDHKSFERQRDRSASTESEKNFHSKYQVILHRLVQRRCTLEMYQRQKNNKFRIDKTVLVKSDSGEFGFRIHGSKPVVVAAIEPDTPAESSGLEVGDILISVNGIQVLDKHHTEVVKIAHDGCEILELQVARTIGVLKSEQREKQSQPIFNGYLWRQSGQAKGSPNANKWVRRWFCLRADNCLYYYKTENDSQPVGALILANHTVEHCRSEIGKPFAFKVDSGEGIPLYVAADSEELANRWINLLKQSAVDGNSWLDVCARYIHLPPKSIVRPDCFGYLWKLGSRWCGWSKRYCVVKDACLYFYQDAKSNSAFGMACLHGYKVASMSTSSSGKKHSFEVIPPDSKLRHYYFSSESDMDKKRWISALEYSIDRWIKSG